MSSDVAWLISEEEHVFDVFRSESDVTHLEAISLFNLSAPLEPFYADGKSYESSTRFCQHLTTVLEHLMGSPLAELGKEDKKICVQLTDPSQQGERIKIHSPILDELAVHCGAGCIKLNLYAKSENHATNDVFAVWTEGLRWNEWENPNFSYVTPGKVIHANRKGFFEEASLQRIEDKMCGQLWRNSNVLKLKIHISICCSLPLVPPVWDFFSKGPTYKYIKNAAQSILKQKCDINLVASTGNLFPCHKILIGHHSSKLEGHMDHVKDKLHLFVPEVSMHAFMEFLYLLKIKTPLKHPNVALDLLAIAVIYEMPCLVDTMKNILLNRPDECYALHILTGLHSFVANRENLTDLSEKALRALKVRFLTEPVSDVQCDTSSVNDRDGDSGSGVNVN